MPRLHFKTDRELDRFVRTYAEANRLTVSQAARELLRQVMGTAKPITRGWLEGYAKGYGEARAELEHKARKLTPPT